MPAGGNEDMFVFQTQSASTASRVIDHRAKDVARREGHTHKSTREGGGAENMYIVCLYMYIHVLMKDEKEGRKKQARSIKTTRQSNTAHPRQSLFLRKMSCFRQSALPLSYVPQQLSWLGPNLTSHSIHLMYMYMRS